MENRPHRGCCRDVPQSHFWPPSGSIDTPFPKENNRPHRGCCRDVPQSLFWPPFGSTDTPCPKCGTTNQFQICSYKGSFWRPSKAPYFWTLPLCIYVLEYCQLSGLPWVIGHRVLLRMVSTSLPGLDLESRLSFTDPPTPT